MSRCFLKPTKKKKKEKSKISQVSEKWKWHSVVSNSVSPHETVACQAPLSMGFSRQEYWSGLPCSSLVDLPNPGIEPGSPALKADTLPSETPEKPPPPPCFTKHKFLAHEQCPLFSKVHSLVQFSADFFTFSTKSCILLCSAIILLCLCYLLKTVV